MNIYPKNGKTLDYLNFENKIQVNYNNFPIGLIIIDKDDKEFKLRLINNYALDILELYHDVEFEDLKNQMKNFKKWENSSLQEIDLYNYIFINQITNCHCGTFISSLSMIFVKVKNFENSFFISIDNYNDERKDLQINLVKSLKYQYLVTLYHELNNPLNALMNIADDCNCIEEKKKMNEKEIILKFKQLNLLAMLIKMFIKNFIWYFRVIFELSNNIIINTNSKINLEYLFFKNLNKYESLFKYKEIDYEKDFIFFRDIFISTDGKHLTNFLRGIFVYLYHILPKKNGFTVKSTILKEEKIKINFIKTIKSPQIGRRRSKVLDDLEFNFKKEFDLSRSVQTIEITKELLFRLASMLNIRIKFYSENEDLIISIILPFSFEKEGIEEKDDIREFSPRQKLLTLNGINRTVPIYNIWQTSFTDIHNDIDNISSSPIQTCLTTQNNLTNHTNYNYNITVTGPNDNYTNIINQESIFSSSNIVNDKKKHQNQNYNKKTTEQNELYKLENDPFIRMTKEKNPFIRELNNEKRDDSFNSYSKKSNSDSDSEEENKEVYVEEENNCFLNYSNQSKNFYTYNAENYQNNMDLNLNKSEIITKKSITYQKQNEMKLNSQITEKKKKNYETNIENMKKKYETNIIDPNRINTKMKDKSKTDNLNINKSNKLNINNNIKNNKNNNSCKRCNDVLLCDDEEFNLSTIKNMLKKFKVNADISTNGKECLDSILKKKELNCNCNKSSYKLLLLDMMMPVMDGFEAAKKIQELINKKEINDCLKIVIVSAHIESNLVKSLKELKCVVEEVAKPLKKTKLEEILNNYYFCN